MIRSPRMLKLGLLVLVLGTNGWAQAQTESLRTKRATDLRDAPSPSAKALATLPEQSPLSPSGKREGPWVAVTSANNGSGWVHLFDLGDAEKPQPSNNAATGALRGLTGLFSRSSSQGNQGVATSTIGIRGLSSADIANAQPNLNAVTEMEALRQTDAQARQFAGAAKLSTVAVAPLAAPRSVAGPTQANSEVSQ